MSSPPPRNAPIACGSISACGAESATPADALRLVCDRRDEAGEGAGAVEGRGAAGALLERGDGDRRGVGRQRRGIGGDLFARKAEHDEIGFERAETERLRLGAEIADEDGEAGRGVAPLEAGRLAPDDRVRTEVGSQRRQRLAGRDDERGRDGGRRRGGDRLAGGGAVSGAPAVFGARTPTVGKG